MTRIWARYLIVMGGIFPLLMLVYNMLVFARVIPEDIIREYIVLTYATPNIPAMILSNYVNANIHHMVENMLGYMTTIILIVLVPMVLIPYLKNRHPEINYRANPWTLVISTVVFLFLAPFAISEESIVVGNMLGISGGYGLSGIVFCFQGYLVYSIEVLIFQKIRIDARQKNDRNVLVGTFAAFGVLVSVGIGQIVSIMFENGYNVNYIAHLVGFMIGLMTPALIDAVWWAVHKRTRRIAYMEKKEKLAMEEVKFTEEEKARWNSLPDNEQWMFKARLVQIVKKIHNGQAYGRENDLQEARRQMAGLVRDMKIRLGDVT